MTNKCNATCQFCCFSCCPENNNTLPVETVDAIIDSLVKRRGIYQIVFTGGEPFLYYEDLKHYFNKITQAGKGVGVFTNGYWCTSREKTMKYLTELKALGLNMIRTSVDAYHQEYVNIDNIKRLLEVANELDILVHVNVSISQGTLDKTSDYINKLGVSKLNASFTYSPMLPIGLSQKSVGKDQYLYTKKREGQYCKYGGLFNILYDGSVHPCCSQAIVDLPFKLGNIYKNDIKDILNKMEKDKLLHLLINYGFDWIIQLLERKKLHKFAEKYIDSCHLCHEIFSNEEYYKVIMESLDEEYSKLVKA
jgi:MoaA/NifB/PqqE/SkfB family radical SAM enzyme